MMEAKEYIKTEYYNNETFRLKKEYDGSITLNHIFAPWSNWSNCTDVELNIRLTPKRLYISRYYFSDLSGQQRTHLSKIYVDRNTEIDFRFKRCIEFKNQNDDIETHAELKSIFYFFHEIFNGA